MSVTFKEVRKLQGQRVRMQFDDGREVVAQLLCATKDMDGTKHLIYDGIESVSAAETRDAGTIGCLYADAKSLIGIEAANAKQVARSLRGWESFGLNQEVSEAEDRRPCA